MARPKGKEKKIPLSSYKEEAGSEEEQSAPLQRKRGRPRKVVKDEAEEEEFKEVASFIENAQTAFTEAGKKRKRQKKVGDTIESGAGKNADANGGGYEESTMPMAVKGNRRKGKPSRAAGSLMDGK